jgi:hypothetical protein
MKNSMKISTEKEFKTKWYDNPVWVYVLIVLFFPVGLYGLYKSNTIGKGIKFTFYAVSGILFVGVMCTKKQPNTTVVSTQQTQEVTNQQTEGSVAYSANGDKLEQVSAEKFGLSEEQRKQVFQENILAERKATKEAESKYDVSKMEGTPQQKMSIFSKYQSGLEEKYKNSLAKKYKIDREQLSEIANEGFLKGWAFPASE